MVKSCRGKGKVVKHGATGFGARAKMMVVSQLSCVKVTASDLQRRNDFVLVFGLVGDWHLDNRGELPF